MGMALDEPSEDDKVFQEGAITFAINKELFEQAKPIRVDFVETDKSSGYKISANLPNSCGSCSC